MKERNRRYSEIVLLACLLEKKGIPYDLSHHRDGYKIRCGTKKKYIISEYQGSIGFEGNRLEMWRGEIVRGYENAESVFREIEEDYNERN